MISIIGFSILAVFLLVVFWALKKEGKGKIIITPFIFFLGCEIAMVWPPTIDSQINGMHRDGFFVLVVAIAVIGFFIGFSLFWKQLELPHLFFKKSITVKHSKDYYVGGILLLGLFLLALGIFHFNGFPKVGQTIVSLFSESVDVDKIANETSQARTMLTKASWFGGTYRGQGVIREVIRLGWPFLIIISLTIFNITKLKQWLLISIVLYLFCFIFVAGDSSRGSFLWSTILIFLSLSLYKQITIKKATAFLLFMFLALMGLSLSSSKGVRYLDEQNTLQLISNKISNRVFLGNGKNNYRIVDFLRARVIRHGYGKWHFQKLISSIPGVHYGTPFAYELYRLVNSTTNHSSTTFYTFTYFGLLYLDFGVLGVFFGYIGIGVIIGFSYRFIFLRPKTIMNVCFVSFWTFIIGKIWFYGPIGIVSTSVVFIAICAIFDIGGKLNQRMAGRHIRAGRSQRLQWQSR